MWFPATHLAKLLRNRNRDAAMNGRPLDSILDLAANQLEELFWQRNFLVLAVFLLVIYVYT